MSEKKTIEAVSEKLRKTKEAILKSPVGKKFNLKKSEEVYGPQNWDSVIEKLKEINGIRAKRFNKNEFKKFYESQQEWEDI